MRAFGIDASSSARPCIPHRPETRARRSGMSRHTPGKSSGTAKWTVQLSSDSTRYGVAEH
jgi:hypothetical protein